MSTTVETTIATTATSARPSPTMCHNLYDTPARDAVCAMPYSDDNLDYLKSCCKGAEIYSYYDCGLYCAAEDQTVGDLTQCLFDAGAGWTDVFCRGNETASATGDGEPIDIPHALEEGLRVAPRLYGGEVYDPGPVTDWKSGGIAAGKNFSHGILEGVGGLVMSPVRGAKKEGALGVAKGVGIGVLNLTTKVTLGTLGLLTFTSQGAYKSARASMRKDTGRAIKQSMRAHGIAILREGKQRVDAAAVVRDFDRQVAQMPESKQWMGLIGSKR